MCPLTILPLYLSPLAHACSRNAWDPASRPARMAHQQPAARSDDILSCLSRRQRANRSVSAERRRSRNLLAAKKKEAELKESRREIDAAQYRQEVRVRTSSVLWLRIQQLLSSLSACCIYRLSRTISVFLAARLGVCAYVCATCCCSR